MTLERSLDRGMRVGIVRSIPGYLLWLGKKGLEVGGTGVGGGRGLI